MSSHARVLRATLRRAAFIVAVVLAGVTCALPVAEVVTDLALDPTTLSLTPGDSAFVTAKVLGTNGTPTTVRLRWSSTDSSVVQVQSGKILALRSGTAHVIASAGGRSDTIAVGVKYPPFPSPRQYAHRGYALLFPENTLIAVTGAFDRGADGVEVDVMLSGDSVPVVIHDETLERTTSGSGRVDAHTADQLRTLDACTWKGAEWTPCHVPTLAEVLDAASGRGTLLLDLKGPWPDTQLRKLLQLTRDAGMRDSVTIISFSLDVLGRVRRIDPRVRLGFLSRTVMDPATALQLENIAILLHDGAIGQAAATMPAYSAALRERGSVLGAWTLYKASSAPPLRDLGVNWFISDVPLDAATLRPAGR